MNAQIDNQSVTSAMRPLASSTQKKAKRLRSLASAEWLQFRRNKVIMFMAVFIPIGIPLMMAGKVLTAEDQQSLNFGAAIATEMFLAMSGLLVLFYSALSMATTRRDESVLKRLRTGEAKDWQILTAICVPGTVILAVLFVPLIVGLVFVGADFPANLLALLAALVGMILIGSLAALVTSAFTKNAEAAQITSMPVIVVGMISFASVREVLPESLRVIAEKNPFGLIYDLVYLGWRGNQASALQKGAGALGPSELMQETGITVLILAVWIAVLVWSTAIYMRWDTHR